MKTIAIGSGIAAFAVLAGSALADTSPTVTEKFAEMDINTDGAVTVGEYTAYAGAAGFDEDEAELQFAVMAGDDGILAVEELAAIMAVEKDASDWESSTSVEVLDEGDGAARGEVDVEVETSLTTSDAEGSES